MRAQAPFQPAPAPAPAAEPETKPGPAAAGTWRPEALYAAALLRELLRERHPAVLCRWGAAAPRVRSAVSAALELPEAQRPGAPHADDIKSDSPAPA